MWHKLRDQPAVQRYGALAKLEMKCLDTAFEEMKSEGFADDGLFPKIKEFFLSLTISERELHMERSSNMLVRGVRLTRCKELGEYIKLCTRKLEKQTNTSQKCTEQICQIEQKIKSHEDESSQAMATWRSKKNSKKQQEALHQLYQDCHRRQFNYLQELNGLKQDKDVMKKIMDDLVNEISKTEKRLETIETELNTPHQPVNEQLVKPPRGLIMYGPPGKFQI